MFFGGKQTIHNVSAAFIVKNCHPRTSLNQQLKMHERGTLSCKVLSVIIRHLNSFTVYLLEINLCGPLLTITTETF